MFILLGLFVLFGFFFVLLVLFVAFSSSPSPNQLLQHKTAWFGAFFLSMPHVPIICLSILCLGSPSNLLLADVCPRPPGLGFCAKECPRRELKEVWRVEPTIMPAIPAFLNNT